MKNNKRNASKLTAILLTGAMLISTVGVQSLAFAAESETDSNAGAGIESYQGPAASDLPEITPEPEEEIIPEGETSEPVVLLDEVSEEEADEIAVATDEEVAAVISGEDKETVLVDARPQEAFAGWKLQGAKNGGHLKGATLYSARFLKVGAKETKINSYNTTFGLSADKSYIIYDYDGFDNAAATVAEYFKSKDVKNVKVYDAKDMIDAGTDVVAYDGYDMYLPTEIVKDVSDYITGKDKTLEPNTLEVFDEKDMDKILIFDVDYGNANETKYTTNGHVPGAVHINTNCYERPRNYTPEKREKYALEYRLIGLDEFRDEFCPQYGITKDSIVIAISTDGRPISRIGFMLKSLGVEFYGMTGLMNAWKYNGYETEKTIERPVSVKEFGSNDIPNPDEIIWCDQVKRILAGEEKGVVYGGDNYKTYSYNDLQGTIEGISKVSDPYSMNVDGTPATKEIMEAAYVKAGFDMDELVVPFCGDGWGASRVAYNAQSVGLDNVKYWGEGWVYWANEGNWFITKKGQKVRYNKYKDALVDEAGKIVDDPEARKPE